MKSTTMQRILTWLVPTSLIIFCGLSFEEYAVEPLRVRIVLLGVSMFCGWLVLRKALIYWHEDVEKASKITDGYKELYADVVKLLQVHMDRQAKRRMFLVTDIVWDDDGEDEPLNLPTSTVFEIFDMSDIDFTEYFTEELTKKFDFCIKSLHVREITILSQENSLTTDVTNS